MKKAIIFIIVLLGLIIFGYVFSTKPAAKMVSDSGEIKSEKSLEVGEGITNYVISDASNVEFRIYELLRGEPFTVVGTTNMISGNISVDESEDGSIFKIGEIRIDARTLKTDSENRDGAINKFILKTGDESNAYITFNSTKISSVGSLKDGEDVVVNIDGNLTISGTTKPIILPVTVKEVGDTLVGTFKTELKRSDYGLVIPSIPFVADVPDTFEVTGSIIANKN